MKDKLKIYLIEDNIVTAKLVEYRLEKQFHADVVILDDLQESLKLIILEKPDLIILDHLLNVQEDGMTGVHLLKELTRRGVEIPTIIFSGNLDKSIAVEMLKSGACDYVVKDKNYMPSLVNAVRNLIIGIDIKKEILELEATKRQVKISMQSLGLMSMGIISIFIIMML